MESFRRITIVLLNILLLSFVCDSVNSLKLTRTDPGNNVTIRWNTGLKKINDISYFFVRNAHNERMIYCRISHGDLVNGKGCIQQASRITPFSAPRSIPSSGYITAIGIVITNVSEADAGAYQIFIGTEIPDKAENILYVFRKPKRPIIIIVSDPLVGQANNITCSAQAQSLPDEYRNQSQMVYTWDIINQAGNHLSSGDNVKIVNVTHENEGATFTCQAHEMWSNLISDSSDTLTLDVYYIEDLNIHLELSDRNSSTLLCVASCNPPCVYTWFDSLLNEIAKQDDIDISYSGQYTCMAQNLAGKLSETLFITVKDIVMQPEDLTAQNGQSSTVNIPIGLGVVGAILLAVTVLLAVLYIRQRRLKNHSPGGETSPPHNPPVYENTSFVNVGKESANTENYSNLSGERESPQPAVYDELTNQREQRSRAELEVYENVTQGE